MTRPADLRPALIELSGGDCEWPGATHPGTQVAHFHSTGMGGRPSAHTLENSGWLCDDHALISDGLFGSGGRQQYVEAHDALGVLLPGPTGPFIEDGPHPRGDWPRLAYERAEYLTAHVAEQRAWATL